MLASERRKIDPRLRVVGYTFFRFVTYYVTNQEVGAAARELKFARLSPDECHVIRDISFCRHEGSEPGRAGGAEQSSRFGSILRSPANAG